MTSFPSFMATTQSMARRWKSSFSDSQAER